MTSAELLFIELIQVALGNRKLLSRSSSDEEWKAIFEIAQKQAVAVVVFDALEGLNQNGQKIPTTLLYEWIGLAEQIKQQNLVANKRCKDITGMFAEAGFVTCILKGQGNAQMYPNPLTRTSGDIDLWVYGERKTITKFVKDRCPEAFEQYHHIDFPIFKDVPVEVHYTPGRLLSPKYNKRFQNWCEAQKKYITSKNKDGFVVPSVEFNAVYQIAHIFIHFFIEGIGLRHFVDYYYVLLNTNFTKAIKVKESLQYLGLEKFARGVMWIEREILGINEDCLLFEPSEKIGKLILQEMMEGGNFGHHNQRYGLRRNGRLGRGIADTYRLLKLFPTFPQESLWKIWNKVENQRWKIKN